MAYRLALVSQASLRVCESVDFDSVLRGALDTARSLTGARYGVMTILDDAGRKHCFLSSKVSGEEGERLWLTREGLSIFQSLTGISEPLRLPDLAEPVRALGSRGSRSPCRWDTPLDGDARVPPGREGGEEFTPTDQETPVMFAAQAALVIANACTHR